MKLHQLSEMPPWEWPDDADHYLLKALSDDSLNESDLMLAVEMAGEYSVINDDLAVALLNIAEDPNKAEEIRGQAAVALGPALEHADTMGFEDPDDLLVSEAVFDRVKTGLQRLYRDTGAPKLLRRRVLEASVRAPQPWHAEAIYDAYQDKDADWILTAVFCMRYIRGFEKEIIKALENDDIDVRYEAVCAAGNWELADAWPFVESILMAEGTDKDLLLAAIEALPSIRPNEVGRYLAPFWDHEDEDIAEAVTDAMSMADMLDSFENGEADEDDF